jgi:hypothetical protein
MSANRALRAGTRSPRAAQAPGAQHPDLPDGGGRADEAGEDGGGGVAADRDCSAAVGVVGDGAPSQPGDASEAVGDAFDQAQGGGPCQATGSGQCVGAALLGGAASLK